MMEFDNLVGIIEYLKANSKNVEVSIGVVMPIVMLILLEWRNRSRVQDPGWANIENQRLSVEKELEESSGSGVFDPMPANIVIASLLICGTAMVFLSLIADSGQGIIVVFAIALFVIAGIIYAGVKRLIRKALN